MAAETDAVNAKLAEAQAQINMHIPLYEAINRAAGELPDGWSICFSVERYGAGVKLFDQDGEEVKDFPTDNERLDITVNDAVDAALSATAQQTDHSVDVNKMVEGQQ